MSNVKGLAWKQVPVALSLTLVLGLLLCLPLRTHADGGPVVPLSVWKTLSEGQQIAVITLDEEDTAQVDLFISLYDESVESHEVTFFIPLGVEAAQFGVEEKTQVDFESVATDDLDTAIDWDARSKFVYPRKVKNRLIFGWLIVHSGWSLPLAPLLAVLTACSTVAPIATFETPSSQLELYDLQEDTDLQALLSTTGLDPSVQETLARLRGQQIAVIKMQTIPSEITPYGRMVTETFGLHLHWRTTLIPGDTGKVYAYPLGTGASWAHPVEATRVYVVGRGTDFEVAYPRLGRDLSGYDSMGLLFPGPPRIRSADEPSYAIERAIRGGEHYWRAIYLQSNSAEDIVITRIDGVSEATQAILRQERTQLAAKLGALAFGTIGSLLLWVLAWWIASARVLGTRHRWWTWELWGSALRWGLLPTLIVGPIVGGLYGFLLLGASLLGMREVVLKGTVPLINVAIVGLLGIAGWLAGELAFKTLISKWRANQPGMPNKRLILAYVAAVFLHIAFYLPLAFGIAALGGAL